VTTKAPRRARPLLFPALCRHDTSGSAWKLLTEFVTLNRVLPRLLRCVTRSRRAVPTQQAGATHADGRGRVCLPAPLGPHA
jgi:hypothetical protein